MDIKFFFLPTDYKDFPKCSILKSDNGELIDLDTNIECLADGDGDDWIEISRMEMNWLLGKSLADRGEFQTSGMFKTITELKINDACFYRTLDSHELCTIVKKNKDGENLNFSLRFENGTEKVISSDSIELCSDVNKHSQSIEEITKLLFDHKGDIQKIDNRKRCVLSLAYNFSNKRFFKMFLDTNQTLLDLSQDHLQSLLHNIVKDKHWDILNLVLQKCDIQQNNNAFLINLSIDALRTNNHELLIVIFRFAKAFDILANGETFLTNLFKENIAVDTIIQVIQMRLFDVNASNGNKDNPLTLACAQLLDTVVETLLQNGADATFNGHKPFEVAHDAKNKMPNKEANAAKIYSLLRTTDVVNNVIVDANTLPIPVETDLELNDIDNQLLEIMRLLVVTKGDIVILSDANKSALTLSYALPNKRLFNILISKHVGAFDLLATVTGQELLTTIVANKDMVTLKMVLDKLVCDDTYEVFLLNSAMTTLTNRMKKHFKMIVAKCKQTNRPINTGETFLTQCFKLNVKETLICDVINSDLFDINQFNASQETPLILASERLMTNCADLLLNKNADKSYRDYYAVDIVVQEGNKVDDTNKRKDAKNVILDIMCGKIKEKLHVTESGFVDIQKISNTREIVGDFQVGDPVTIETSNDPPQILSGQVKSFGLINNEPCVGIELDHVHPDGMDGTFSDNFSFECLPGHGILAPINNVKLDVDSKKVHFLSCNVIDPNRYLKCDEYVDQGIFKVLPFGKNDEVYGHILENRVNIKIKGILRWFGTMNGVIVGIIELDTDYENGTNGRFWKYQLIKCQDKRAIALQIQNISKYIPYKMMKIPDKESIFKNIDVNSRVVCYDKLHDKISSLFGVVRWTGMNPLSQYVYGIELDEELKSGTDGTFDNQKLFKCANKRGKIALVNTIAPDFTILEIDVPPDDIISLDSMTFQYCLPRRKYAGKGTGIQGRNDSAFLDSFIFALYLQSDCLDFLMNSRVNDQEQNYTIKKLREVLLWKIVCPIREYSFISWHKIKEFRDIVREYNLKCDELNNPERDLENFEPILKELCIDDHLLSFITTSSEKSSSMFLKASAKDRNYRTTQHLLNITMTERELFFEKNPTCLILKIPIGTDNNFKIIPSSSIEISNFCLNFFHQCSSDDCDKVVIFRCKICSKINESKNNGLFCTRHKCKHEVARETLISKNGSHSEVQLLLKSIICYDDGHAVAYVRNYETDDSWLYFDNGINRKPIDPEIQEIIKMPLKLFEEGRQLNIDNAEHVKRIAEKSYIFVYFCPTKTCY